MFVDLKQYKHEEAEHNNKATSEGQTSDTFEKGSEEYFGENVDDFDVETWETVEYDGDPVQRRYVTVGGATAVSVPKEPADQDDPDLPGRTIQLRFGGGIEYLPQAEIVEVEDENPAAPDDAPRGKSPAGEDQQKADSEARDTSITGGDS
jgi:hypothetical protein